MDHFKLQILQEALDILEETIPTGICTAIAVAVETLAGIEEYAEILFPEISRKIQLSIEWRNRQLYIWPCTEHYKNARIKYLQRLIEEEI